MTPQALALDKPARAHARRGQTTDRKIPGEESCLSLVWAVIDLQINNTCNGIKHSDIDRHKLYRLHHQPAKSATESKEVTAA